MVKGGDASRAGELLEGAPGRSPSGLGVAQRPDTTGGAELQRSDIFLWSFWGAIQRVSRVESPRGSDVIHGALGGIPDVVEPLQRAGRPCGGVRSARADEDRGT